MLTILKQCQPTRSVWPFGWGCQKNKELTISKVQFATGLSPANQTYYSALCGQEAGTSLFPPNQLNLANNVLHNFQYLERNLTTNIVVSLNKRTIPELMVFSMSNSKSSTAPQTLSSCLATFIHITCRIVAPQEAIQKLRREVPFH